MRVVAEDVVLGRIYFRRLDELDWEVVPEVLPQLAASVRAPAPSSPRRRVLDLRVVEDPGEVSEREEEEGREEEEEGEEDAGNWQQHEHGAVEHDGQRLKAPLDRNA